MTVMPVNGAAELQRLARAIRDAGDKDLERELVAGLRRAVRPMKKEFQRGALGILPHRGGLAELVAGGMRLRSNVSVGRSPRVRVSATLPGHDLEAMDRGQLRHPVYGHHTWVSQAIRPGWWTDSGTLAAEDARKELDNAIDAVARKLAS